MSTAEPLRRLASMTSGNLRLALNSVHIGSSGDLEIEIPPRPSEWRFRYAGLVYTVALDPGEESSSVQVKARVGTLPYSAESAESRRVGLAILRHARTLSAARFVVDRHQSVWMTGNAVVQDTLTPETVMVEILRVIQEGRPYLRLFQEVLVPYARH